MEKGQIIGIEVPDIVIWQQLQSERVWIAQQERAGAEVGGGDGQQPSWMKPPHLWQLPQQLLQRSAAECASSPTQLDDGSDIPTRVLS